MNVTEIARRLGIPPRELKGLLQEFGFGVGRRAIKVDKRVADRILKRGAELKAAYDERRKRAEDALKIVVPDTVPQEIVLPQEIAVKDFAAILSVPVTKLLGELMKNGIIVTLNDLIDVETAQIIAGDLGRTVRVADADAAAEKEETSADAIDTSGFKDTRPPTVVIMGHVDHGKTLLLDTIRKTNVIAGESGGITQHIGAYQVERHGEKITFIDTPGHEAFTTMRSRGAKIADIAILVVAADDGVQPQTKEAVSIIEGSGIPLVVAMNKMDKEGVNPDKVKKELADLNLISEEWGGKTTIVPISAKEGTGIDDLLDTVLLMTEVDKEKRATSRSVDAVTTVIESHVDTSAGPLATVLVQLGTLRVGDVLGIRSAQYGKVRALRDWNGKQIDEAEPGTPVVILGLKVAPEVGDIIRVADPSTLDKLKISGSSHRAVASSIEKRKQKKEEMHLPIVLRADVVGSLEAISLSLEKLSTHDASVSIIAKGLGSISEKDIFEAEVGGAFSCAANAGRSGACSGQRRDHHSIGSYLRSYR
jgi:translation initiation factor IF-2